MDTPCPGCRGPITFSPCGNDGIVVYFHCPDPECIYGKPDGWRRGDPVPVVQSPVEVI